MEINLSKKATRDIVDICLSKAGYSDNVVAKVNIILDGSWSMKELYLNNTVSALVDRALAVGYKFDDDGAIDVFDFSNDNCHRELPQATQDDHGSYMKGKSILGGGTAYAPVLQRVSDFYFKQGEAVETKGGFLGMFGKKVVTNTFPDGRDSLEDKHPVFSMFITDGDTQREGNDRKVIHNILREHPDMFIQFIGIGNGSRFTFLKELDGQHNNCGFIEVRNLRDTTDEDLMTGILSQKAKAILQK